MRQEIVANKETHEDPIINGSLQTRQIQTTVRISLGCYRKAKTCVDGVSLQLMLMSGSSKHYLCTNVFHSDDQMPQCHCMKCNTWFNTHQCVYMSHTQYKVGDC